MTINEPIFRTCITCGLDHPGRGDDCWRCVGFNEEVAAMRDRERQEQDAIEQQLQADIEAGTYGPSAPAPH
ncbi:hypothetical protein FIU88_18205 (plasmid) [Halomonas sp. THAF12]|uniref:hypothetical protein n=1 Tax=Halomonas sp. THAF12 TaxID=2587849 RepID=UPI001267C1B8|nr:hypothetical protein [Halomonas sp. THAF12]QFT86884.1 hypothetical protein FIU88_18205 [Halomonas sp. THAF12]